MYSWLEKRLPAFFVQLSACKTETEVKAVCESEKDAWRTGLASGTPISDSSMRKHITAIRKAVLASTELAGNVKTWAFDGINHSGEKWVEVNAAIIQQRDTRLETQSLICDVDGIVAKAVELLESSSWQDVATGLLVLTGRRLTEVLKTATFEVKTDYTVMFSGQEKTRVEDFPAYEIPTLSQSESVVAGLAHLRSMKNFTDKSNATVVANYGKQVAESARRHFSTLIPPKATQKQIAPHTFRAVYARIAVLYFCPVGVNELYYVSTTQGHYTIKDDKVVRDFLADLHYADYRIIDAQGQIDGRQGIRLGDSGVQTLECFADKVARVQAKPVNAPYRSFRVTEKAVEVKESSSIMAEIGLSDELVARAYSLVGESDIIEFVRQAVEKEIRMREAVAKRSDSKDIASMALEDLKKVKSRTAVDERVRRAIAAIANYNDSVASNNDRWYINAGTVQVLTGGRFAPIAEYVEANKTEIDAMNEKYNLTQVYNRKPYKVNTVITIE